VTLALGADLTALFITCCGAPPCLKRHPHGFEARVVAGFERGLPAFEVALAVEEVPPE